MKRVVRTFLRAPGFSVVVILTLAVGIGANTAIFSVVRGILLRPLPYAEPDRLVATSNRAVMGGGQPQSVLEYLDTREQAERLEAIAAWTGGTGNLSAGDTRERVEVGLASGDFFPLLGVAPAVGRLIGPGDDVEGQDQVAVLAHDLWETRFAGDPAIVGRAIQLHGSSYQVIGVLPASFRFQAPFAVWVPLTFTAAHREPKTRDQHWLRVVGRLERGVSVEALNADLALLGARIRKAHPGVYSEESQWRPEARPLLDATVADVRASLWLLAAAAGLVLLIVCGNVASLLLARAATRERELSVRAALGASRRRLFGQLLGESLVLSAIGGLLGVLLALWGTDLLLALAPDGLPRVDEIRVDGLVLGFSVLVTAVTGAVFGMIPAWSASRVELHDALRAAGRAATGGKHPRRVRRALVVAETALALLLVMAAALITRSFGRVLGVDPGFRTADVLSLRLSVPAPEEGASAGETARFESWFTDATERLAALPGVTHAGAINLLPLRDGWSDRLLELEDKPAAGADRPGAEYRVVTPGYLETMAIPLLHGRGLAREDGKDGPPVVLVSRAFVQKYWPGEEPLGKRLRLYSPQGPWTTVVGVVADVRHGGLDQRVEPTLYFPRAQSPGAGTMSIVVRGEVPPAQLAGVARAELQRFDPSVPLYDVRSMTERLAASLERRRFVLVLFELFAGLALGLAALGLYGVLAQAVADRRREIAMRVALGATRGKVAALVAREGAVLVGVGVGLGALAGIAGVKLLRHMLYETSPADPLALLAAVAALAVVSAIATWLPMRRALRVDPMVALRDE